MALILNIETATTVCSVALSQNGNVVAAKEINSGYTHAENLTTFINIVLIEAKVDFKQLDAIAVSKGPGSYTGLRIGVSTAKGLCYALDKPLIAINTLQSMCSPLLGKSNNLLCPMIDARRMEVYCALYDSKGKEIEKTSAKIIDENSFSALLENNTVIFFGDGSAKCREAFSKNKNAILNDVVLPSAISMATISEQLFNQNSFEDLAYFEPFYLKDFVTK